MTHNANSSIEAARTELYEIIQTDVPFEEKAREALNVGTECLGVDTAHLARIDRQTNSWEALISTDQSNGQFPQGVKIDLSTTYCRRVGREPPSIALSDAPNQGWADDPAFETHGLHCYLGTSLVVDGESYGTACFVATDSREEFSDKEIMFAELIAKLLEREIKCEQQKAALARQTNLATVLNRVLRHNVRNNLSAIRGFTQLMADNLGDTQYSKVTLRNIDNLLALSDKARQLDRIVAADTKPEPVDMTALAETITTRISRRYPTASVRVVSDEAVTATVLPSFEQALVELVDNAVKHSGEAPTVTICVEAGPTGVEIHIADTGPGLASHEIAVLETDTETPLIHGSGLGLWLANWVVTRHNGTIDATVTDEGTNMTISLPRNLQTEGVIHQHVSELYRARDLFEATFQEASDAMIIINNDAQIVHANVEAGRIYGTDQQALLGQSIARFFPDDFDFEATWSGFEESGYARDTVTIVGEDGLEREVEYSAKTDIVPGQHLIIGRLVTE